MSEPAVRSAFLQACRPLVRLIPEISKPDFRPSFNERLKWTVAALGIFLMCCQIPVFGARPPDASDPFYWMRVVLASNKGTLMEFGISPIVTSSMIMQLVSAAKLIDYDSPSKQEQKLFQGAQKVLGLGILLLEVLAYVLSGMYGSVSDIGVFSALIIIVQLVLACILCILLDELLTSGWGYGSGISLFIACNICETIMWKMFSPVTVNVGRGTEVEGAVFALVQLLFVRPDKTRALHEAMYRPQLPNITNLLATVFIFMVVMFLQGFQVNLTCVSKKNSNTYQYPIKLFYTSNMPIILQASLLSNIYFISKLLFHQFGNDNILVALMGQWEEPEYAGNEGMSIPVGGLAYFLSPPTSMWAIWSDPFHAVIYVTFMLLTCGLFSRMWIEVSGSSPRDVAQQLRDENFAIKGYQGDEKTVLRELKRYIPIAAAFGGMCIGMLSVAGDFLGAIGSGTGILLACSIIAEYNEIIQKERYPQPTASAYKSNVELKFGKGE